jgi:hypothetical protein
MAQAPQVGDAAPVGDPPPVIDAADVDEPAAPATAAPTTPPAAGTAKEAERVRLVFIPGPFSSACPSSDDVARLVAGHLGRDPFGEPATRVMTLLLDGAGATPTRARLELLGASLAPLGSRVVEGNSGCADLVATAALQMAIALDPLAITSANDPAEAAAADPTPAPTAPPTTPTTDVIVDDTPDASDDKNRRRRVVIVEEGIGVVVGGDAHVANWLVSDAPMLGFTVGAALRGGMFSARTELRLDFGATSDDDQGALPALVSVLPCAHVPILDLGGEDGRFDAAACGTVTAGLLPELTNAVRVGGYAGAGVRLGLDWHLDSTSVVHFFGQSEVALWRAGIVGSPTVSTSPLNVVVGVGFDIGDWE